MFVDIVDVVKRSGSGFVDYLWPKPGYSEPVPKISYVQEFSPWGWVIGTGVYIDDINTAFWGSAKWVMGFITAFTLLVIIFVQAISRSIARPLLKTVEVADAVAKGDLSQHIEMVSEEEVGQLMHALKNMKSSLTGIVDEVRNSAEAITAAAQKYASVNSDLSSSTEQQAASLQETASSMEEITTTVKQSSENARQASSLAANVSNIAIKGRKLVDEVVENMSAISTSSGKIADIIGVIEGIAFQVNILALNAAVEASRVGDQGRGFAVGASEVRNLGQPSAAAESMQGQDLALMDSVGIFRLESGAAKSAIGMARPLIPPQ